MNHKLSEQIRMTALAIHLKRFFTNKSEQVLSLTSKSLEAKQNFFHSNFHSSRFRPQWSKVVIRK